MKNVREFLSGPPKPLPKELEELSIKDMAIGQAAYTVPWAMFVDEERRCWLHGGYSWTSRPSGTSSMFILRLEGGFAVDLRCGREWKPGSAHYVGGVSVALPVVHRIGFDAPISDVERARRALG